MGGDTSKSSLTIKFFNTSGAGKEAPVDGDGVGHCRLDEAMVQCRIDVDVVRLVFDSVASTQLDAGTGPCCADLLCVRRHIIHSSSFH